MSSDQYIWAGIFWKQNHTTTISPGEEKMNKKGFVLFSILIALLSMAGGFLPAPAEAATAAKTPTTTPTRRPSTSFGEFSLNRINKIPPADIINQIALTGQGGAKGCKATSYPAPVLLGEQNIDEELMVYTVLIACGWAKNEKLTGSVEYPNGQTQALIVDTSISNGINKGIIEFRPGLDDPVGKYILSISGKSGIVRKVVNYSAPRSAAIYTLDEYHLLLNGFSASEGIRLFYYSLSGGDLLGWQEYSADRAGRLEIQTSVKIGSKGVFIAVGNKTGEVRMEGERSVFTRTIILGKPLCSNGLPSRVKVGDRARAAYTDGSNLRIRVQPGFSQNYEHKVPEGTQMKIVGGPKCADDSTWWKVEISGNIKGWVAEYWDGDEYLIEPIY